MHKNETTREINLQNRIDYNQKAQIGIFWFGVIITALEASSLLIVDNNEIRILGGLIGLVVVGKFISDHSTLQKEVEADQAELDQLQKHKKH